MAFWKKPSFLLGAGYYLVVSLAIILFSSPLFRILGFEYSGLIALFASIHLLFYSAYRSIEQRGRSSWSILKKTVFPVFILSSIPLLISIISTLYIPNCSLSDGVLFYFEIVYPTALIAVLCGIFIGISPRSRMRMNIFLASFWVGTFILSLLPGYFSAKIFTYGWQYGYFPGLVWDEALELGAGYLWSRVIEISLIIVWIVYNEYSILEAKPHSARENKFSLSRIFSSWQYWLMIVSSGMFAILFNSQCEDSELERFLPNTEVVNSAHIHYSVASIHEDELTLIKYNIKLYQEEIDSFYQLKKSSSLDIYIFPTADDLYKYVGTREASITKPWKRSIYITKQNLQSLKHELVHAMLSEFGSFPFSMSWSTGLTEGSAVAMEDDYDGIRNCDEMSARILQMKFAKGVADIMLPSGFLSSASAQSYELSGSFSKYLLKTYGAEKYLQLYRETDFDGIYSKSLVQLESDWKTDILQRYSRSMGHYDSLRTTFYFKRTSIIQDPCLRRTGKLLKNADDAFRAKNYFLADSLYAIAEHQSGRLKAIRGKVLSQLFLNNRRGALAILDTTTSAKEANNLSALRILRGDVVALATGDLAKASSEWGKAMRLELGENYFLASFVRENFISKLTDISQAQRILRDLYGIEEVKDKYALIFSSDSSQHEPEFYKARLFLYVSYLEKTGKLKDAYETWVNESHKFPRDYRDVILESEVLFDKLMTRKYYHYDKIFKINQHAEIKTLP